MPEMCLKALNVLELIVYKWWCGFENTNETCPGK